MKLAWPIFTWLLFAGLTTTAFGEGIKYPDDTVSPFPPAFFGIGHLQPYERSEANGVAAVGGVLLGVVGFVDNGPVGYFPQAVFRSANGSLLYLPGSESDSSEVWAISPDGVRKAGYARGPAMWDASLNYKALPVAPGYLGGTAFAVSANGAAIVGTSATGQQPPKGEATRWPSDGSAPTLLGLLSGYDISSGRGVSADGQVVCGVAFNSAEALTNGASIYQRAFRKAFTSPMEDLGTLSGHTDALAYGINSDGDFIVGQSYDQSSGGSSAFVWTNGHMSALPGPGGSASVGVAYAVTVRSGLLDRVVAVGLAGISIGEEEAFFWTNLPSAKAERIAALLTNTYRHPLPTGWRLTRATGISQDGYTICGVGYNPKGKTEGWVAVLPPILYPPKIDPIPPQRAELDKLFSFQVVGSFGPDDRFSAEKLPDGFQIDSVTGKITGTWRDILKAIPGPHTVTVSATRPTQGTGYRSFTLTLPPPTSVKQLINGHSFLPYAKPPGETYFPTSFGLGLSGNGQVAVGYSGPNNDPRAYRWTAAEGMTPLPVMEGALQHYGNAYAASADGRVIVGQATTAAAEDGSSQNVAVMWNATAASSGDASANSGASPDTESAAAGTTITSLGFIPGGTSSVANGVSADGTVIVGHGSDYDPDVQGSGTRQAFRWTVADGMVGLGWLPGGEFGDSSTALAVSDDGSVIVGGSTSANGSQAFRWTAAEGMTGLGIASGASFSRATGVSGDNGTIIGHNGFSNRNRAFRWTAAEGMTQLGFLPGDDVSEARGISFDGSVIVGMSTVGFNPARAFIWDKTNGMRDLKEVLVAGNPNLSNWTLRDALGISADGTTVVGWGKNPTGDLEGFTAYLEVQPPQLLNISTRMRVLSGENVLIGGFIITGSDVKKVVIRGIGPSLDSSGVQGALADPTLELHQGNTTLASNDNWKEHQAEVEETTIPPTSDLESAIVATLSPGSYSAILADKNGASGVGVVEVYDLAQAASSQLANISSRGFVDTGDNVMIGGLIVGGGSGVGSGRVLLRAIGPSLGGAGVTGALQDPTLELFDNSGTSVASNDDWMATQQAEIEATTIPPSDDRESAIVATLPAGNYTAVVRGKDNTTGIAVVEAYNIP